MHQRIVVVKPDAKVASAPALQRELVETCEDRPLLLRGNTGHP